MTKSLTWRTWGRRAGKEDMSEATFRCVKFGCPLDFIVETNGDKRYESLQNKLFQVFLAA